MRCRHLLVALVILFFAFLGKIDASRQVRDNPGLCIATHCFFQASTCALDSVCFEILNCLNVCSQTPDDAQCPFACIMSEGHVGNENFRDLLKCMVDNGCMTKYEEDGRCLANDDEALQEIVDIEQLKGDWWVLKGQNCGQDETWRGSYDWYPCQHARFVKAEDGDWINNTTYCNGKDSVCTSDTIVTIPKLKMISPGVVRHDYPNTEAPIVPQIEDWKFVSIPDPDWALVIWCGSNPVLKYNGAFVVSRNRSLSNISPEIEDALRSAASKFGLDYDAMCVSENTGCKD